MPPARSTASSSAAKYKKDPAVAEAARQALEGYLDKLIQRLQTKNIVQLDTTREALVHRRRRRRATASSSSSRRATCTGARTPPTCSG